jgi:O-acetyl-ADP-ribose deacetylase (regulator of RNase III)
MPHYGTGKSTPETIRESVRNTLHEADNLGLTSLSIPAVGCGLGGVPLATGAQVIGEELNTFTPTSLESVSFVAYTNEEYETIARVLGVQ